MSGYDDNFYKKRKAMTEPSSEAVLKTLAEDWKGEIHSAVDMGCGIGVWLNTVKKVFGDVRVRGVDGGYVNKKYLVINKEDFEEWDLEKPYFAEHMDKYDLAISLEVAEHLSEERADSFVDDLTNMSDLVLFSAAIPYQKILGGAVHHVNEQPLSYWVKKFAERGYKMHDIIRPRLWDNNEIMVHYRQNCVLFIKQGSMSESKLLPKEYPHIIDIVHPDSFGIVGNMLSGRLGRLYLKIENFMIVLRAKLGRD